MTKASDNAYPSVLVVEGTTPASPSSGDQRLFIDSADHTLKRVNSGGTVTVVEGGGSSSWTLLSEFSGNGTSGTNTWSAIAGTYRGLKLVGAARATPASNYQSLELRLNGDTGANYNRHIVTASATTVTESESNSQTSLFLADTPSGNQSAGDSLSIELTIWRYADTTFYKQVQSRCTIFPSSGGNVFDEWVGGLWLSTAAITSVTALLDSGNFATGTKLALYGIT